MNTIERNYSSKLNLRETQEAIIFIEQQLLAKMANRINFLEVRAPMISNKRNVMESLVSLDGNRTINFDTSKDNEIYYFFNNYRYWLLKSLKTLDIKNNNGVGIVVNFIERDVEIKNTQSMEKNLFLLEIRYENKEKIFEKGNEFMEILIKIINEINNELKRQYPKLSLKIPKTIAKKELRKISKLGNVNEKLNDIGSEEGLYFLIDKKDNNSFNRDSQSTFSIILFSYSKEIDESYPIFKIHDRKTFEDIEKVELNSENLMEEYFLGKEFLKKNNIRSINIEINLDALALLLLEKTHILELQSGDSIDEIEKIFQNSNIKHL